jgi:hypothetical protein
MIEQPAQIAKVRLRDLLFGLGVAAPSGYEADGR